MIKPTIIIDIETTGLPNKPRGYSPRVTEIGAVVVDSSGEIASTFSAVVLQDREHLEHSNANYAMNMSDLSVEKVLAEGRDEDRLSTAFTFWLGRMAGKYGAHTVQDDGSIVNVPMTVQAFNQSFDFGFLDRSPWNLPSTGLVRGEDIMTAAMDIMGPAGALPQWSGGGRYKWPKSSEAAKFFGVEHQGTSHRALPDAKTEALVWVEILRWRDSRSVSSASSTSSSSAGRSR